MRILVVEDDADLAEVVAMSLRRDGSAVDVADGCNAAADLASVTTYDVVVLDLGLPDGDGLDLCAALVRGGSATGLALEKPQRILMLTARDAIESRVAGLDAGADDYLVKPFKLAELGARVRALGRRREHRGGPIEVGDLCVDVVARRVTRGSRAVDLTAREFSVVRYLAVRAGEVVSAEEIFEHCWDANANPFTDSVRVIVSRIRKKLGAPDPIATVVGTGYRLGEG